MELGNAIFGHSRGAYKLQREGYQGLIKELFAAAFPDSDLWTRSYGMEFKNEVWECHPYCWCEREDCPQCSDGAPNFIYHPTGLEIHWYKYPLRDAYSNYEISLAEFAGMIKHCKESLVADTAAPQNHLRNIYDLVANDAFAMTFQSMGQYRSAILQAIREQM